VDNDEGSLWSAFSAETADKVYDAWIVVDLAAYYDINLIAIRWEGACSKTYHVDFSEDKETWRTAYEAGWNAIATHWEYLYGTSENATKVRYVRVFSTEAVSTYGIKIMDIKVFGTTYVPEGDTEKPVMGEASLVSKTWNSAIIAVAATDNEGIGGFHVVDAENEFDDTFVPSSESKITVTGLKPSTTYNFTITAIDLSGNESANTIVVENVTTPIDETIPQTAAPAPTRAAANVRPIYCDAYESILAHDFDKNGFAGAPLMQEKDFSGDKCLVYDIALYVEITWGMYDDGNRAIIAQPEYRATDKMGVDASGMDSLHLDIFSSVAMSNIEIRICDNLLSRINVTGEGWQSFDIDLANPLEALANINNVRWFKFTNLKTQNRQKITFDNVYFYKKATIVPTSIDNNVEAVKAVKMIENGQLIIIKNGIRYNVAGQMVK